MIELTREIRFSLAEQGNDDSPFVTNSWAGWPSSPFPAPFVILQYSLRGEIDPELGYLVNICEVDKVVRNRLLPRIQQLQERTTHEQLTELAFHELRQPFNSIPPIQIRWKPTPFLSYGISTESFPMLQITQQFEFSASHRLHNPDLSEERNREVYGKCNNPLGHGHNYILDVTLEGELDERGQLIALDVFEATVKAEVIDPLDHKYLNLEIDEFKTLNPSVENIAKVIFERLDNQFGSAKLKTVRVFESPKTWADYSGN